MRSEHLLLDCAYCAPKMLKTISFCSFECGLQSSREILQLCSPYAYLRPPVQALQMLHAVCAFLQNQLHGNAQLCDRKHGFIQSSVTCSMDSLTLFYFTHCQKADILVDFGCVLQPPLSAIALAPSPAVTSFILSLNYEMPSWSLCYTVFACVGFTSASSEPCC